MQVQSDGKQDKIEQHISDKATKSKKKKILIVSCIVIVIMVFLVLFLPATGRITITRGEAMRMRCNLLTKWHEHVRPYIRLNNQKPLSLIEICQTADRIGPRIFPPGDNLRNDKFPAKYTLESLNDPNLFKKEVPYGLFQGSEGWLIRELIPGKVYKNMLMIDQDGQIYEIRELSKEKYGHP